MSPDGSTHDDHDVPQNQWTAEAAETISRGTDDSDTDDPDTDDAIEIDDVETDAAFLEEREPGDYPSTLLITSKPDAEHRQEALERAERWEAGEAVPHVINFEDPSDLRALLTDRRLELLRSVAAERPDSLRRLADRLDRDVTSVHDDLAVLEEYDIVFFEQEGRAKRPLVPYDTIEVTLQIRTGDRGDDHVVA